MAIDPAIPLQSQFQAPSVGAMAGGANQLMQVQQQQQAMQAQNMLRQLYSDPTNTDDDGQLKPNALKQVFAADPKVGMAVQTNQFKMQQQKMHMDMLTSDRFQKQIEFANKVKTDARIAYEDALRRGNTPDQAHKIGQDTLTSGVEDMRSSGLYNQAWMDKVKGQFDPNSFPSDEATYMKYQQLVENSKKEKFKEQREVGQDIETGMHHRNTEAIAEKNAEAKPETKWTVMTDPGTKDDQGNPVQFRYNPMTAQSTTLEGKPFTPTGAAKIGADGSVLDPAAMQTMAKQIASYQMAPLSGFALARPGGQALMAEVAKINPDYQAARFGEVNKTMSAFGSGKQGDIVRALNVATQHLSVIDQAADALKNGDVQLFNRLGNSIAQATGNPAPTTFDGLKQIVGTEIEKAVAGGIGAVADRDRLMEALSRANSPAQLAQMSESFKKLMAGQAKGLKTQYEDATGFKSDSPWSFDKKLLPDTQKELGLVEGEGKASAPAKGSAPPAASFNTAHDVGQAYKDGKITKEQALKILREKFEQQ